jgi:hypothetical protein
MTKWTCYDCTGRGDELLVFEVRVGGNEYQHKPSACPVCGQYKTIETLKSYFTRSDDRRYSVQ